MLVRYRWQMNHDHDDLVCEITEYFDKFLLPELGRHHWYITYLYNDLVETSEGQLLVAFRTPGATRGSFELTRLDNNRFSIKDIHFNYDVCFGEFACYSKSLIEECKQFIGDIIDFSDVKLMNNKGE